MEVLRGVGRYDGVQTRDSPGPTALPFHIVRLYLVALIKGTMQGTLDNTHFL